MNAIYIGTETLRFYEDSKVHNTARTRLITVSERDISVKARYGFDLNQTSCYILFHYALNLNKDISVIINVVSFLFSGGEVRLSSLGTSATNWPIVPAPDDR
jgi:hypothetical protein